MKSQGLINFGLVLLNIAIILLAEFVGGGTLFFEKGIIHGIALVFIIGVAISILHRYYFADPILKKFLNACLIAFGVFSLSHVVEFFINQIVGNYGDYLFALTLNFYIISLLIMISGSEIFLRAYSGYQRSWRAFILSNLVIAALVVFSIFIFFNNSLISLEPLNATPYIYTAVVLIITFLFWRRVAILRRAFSLIANFFDLLRWMVALVAISAIVYALYDLVQLSFGLPGYQIVYLSHFLFYIGISVMFVAFQKLSMVGGGVIDDIKNLKTI